MSPYFGENLPNWPSIVHFFKEVAPLHHFIGKSPRVLLNANNRTETDFADDPLFWRKLWDNFKVGWLGVAKYTNAVFFFFFFG